jgi:hypothetical protein
MPGSVEPFKWQDFPEREIAKEAMQRGEVFHL